MNTQPERCARPATRTARARNHWTRLLLCLFATSTASASQSWIPAADMSHERRFASATLLDDGTVLVAGGENIDGVLSASEIYAPALDAWLPAPDIPWGRVSHHAIALANGEVMILGGVSALSPSPPALPVLVYDPDDGQWHASPGALAPRTLDSATLLDNGSVLLVGGYDESQIPGATLFDPTTGNSVSTAAMQIPRFDHVALKLTDGRVLVAGGSTTPGAGTATAACEVYDPVANTWSPVASLAFARQAANAILLDDGKVLVAGGAVDGSTVRMSETYDPTTNTWTDSGELSVGRFVPTLTRLPDGRILAVGGVGEAAPVASAELFDQVTRQWSAAGRMADLRSGHTATLLPNGRVLVAGGNGFNFLRSAELYDPQRIYADGFE